MKYVQEKILNTFGDDALEYFNKNLYYQIDTGYIEFVGWNCDDLTDNVLCYGWDGISRRCSCGNRRVNWVWNNNELYAEAY